MVADAQAAVCCVPSGRRRIRQWGPILRRRLGAARQAGGGRRRDEDGRVHRGQPGEWSAHAGQTLDRISDANPQPYYDYFTHHLHPASSKPRTLTLDTPLSTFPLLLQGGNILPVRQRVRRSSPLMWQDPFTLIVALSKENTASGQLYLDDGETFGYEAGQYVWRSFDFVPTKGKAGHGGVLRSSDRAAEQSAATSTTDVTPYDVGNAWAQSVGHVQVERIVVLGLKAKPARVTVKGQELEWTWEDGKAATAKKEGGSSRLSVKSPGVGVVEAWEVEIE